MSYSDWITLNTRLRKKAFSFKGYEFQQQIVDDMHPNLHVIKCSQIGLTETQLRKFAAFLARNTGVSGIFTLPDDNMFKRVSQTRFGPMVTMDEAFNKGGTERPIRSMSLYQIGTSYGYFTGSKESDATSINADILFHDEVDLTDQEMLALFQSRLQGSDWKITHNFSTPTFENFGIHSGFKLSDQHEYMAKCTKCRHWNIPEFSPRFISVPGLPSDTEDLVKLDSEILASMELDKAILICENCRNPLDLTDPTLREWVARHPGRRSRGYRVTPFCTPRLPVTYIFDQLERYKQRDAIRRFHNTVLGMPYSDSTARLSETEIRSVMNGGNIPVISGPVIMGIDVGITCHITLATADSRKPVIFEWRTVLAENLISEIENIRDTFNIVGGCIDRYPYTPLSNEIRDLTDGLIMPIEYASTGSPADVLLVKDELGEFSHVRANRTSMIDYVATSIRKRRVSFEGYTTHEGELIEHFSDMVRVERDDKSALWQKLNGNDHFFHSAAYCLFSLKVHDTLQYRSDADIRQNILFTGVETLNHSESVNSIQSRRKTIMSLGTT